MTPEIMPRCSHNTTASGIVRRLTTTILLALMFLTSGVRSMAIILGSGPKVTTQPSNQTVNPGQKAQFTAVTTGTLPINFQWQKNSVPLSDDGRIVGSTSYTLAINGADQPDEGGYLCVATNDYGTTQSNSATLTVRDPAAILTNPVSQVVGTGATVYMTVTTTGTSPLTYTWRKNGNKVNNSGTHITGASTSNMKIIVQSSDAGKFVCTVTNAANPTGAASTTATLSVTNHLMVDKDSTAPVPDGLTWDTAYPSIQSAINAAAAGNIGQVWVAEGIYHEAITMKSKVSVYGGFSGVETTLSARNAKLNRTVISGNLFTGPFSQGGFFGVTHVVTYASVNQTTLDGFTINGGEAMNFFPPYLAEDAEGGGVFFKNIAAGSVNTISNCTISGNSAQNYGAGMAIEHCAPSTIAVTDCAFCNNNSSSGGALYCNAISAAAFTRCTFVGNYANMMANAVCTSSSAPSFTNCIFSNNQSNRNFPTVNIPQNTFSTIACTTQSATRLTNCTISENNGGVFCDKISSLTLCNTILTSNTAGALVSSDIPTIVLGDSSGRTGAIAKPLITVTNCLFNGNPQGDFIKDGVTYSGAPTLNGFPGWTGNVDGLPSFVDTNTSGTWTDYSAFDFMNHTTTLTDTSSTLTSHTLIGRYILPNTALPDQVRVIDNTTTMILVEGNVSEIAGLGTPWKLVDYHLGGQSAAIDTGTSATAPSTDFDAKTRPIDIYGVGGSGNNAYDIGAYEYSSGVLLTVVSSKGIVTPPVGSYDFAEGTHVDVSAIPPGPQPDGTTVTCTGWTGTGSVPATGTTDHTSFTITRNSSITWGWQTKYKLTMVSKPEYAGFLMGEGWYNAGASATIRALANPGWKFINWTGSKTSTNWQTSLNMNTSSTVYANFQEAIPPVPMITSTQTSPTSTYRIPITIRFSEPVVGFIPTDVQVTSGVMSDWVNVSPTSFTCTVTPLGNGPITLTIPAGVCTDLANNQNVMADFSITYQQVPVSVTISNPSTLYTVDGPVTYDVTYTGTETNYLSPAMIHLNKARGSANGTVSVDNGDTTHPTVRISNTTGNGTLGITIYPGTGKDPLGNWAPGAGPSATFTTDHIRPNVTLGLGDPSPTKLGQVRFIATFSERIDNLTPANFTLTGTGDQTAATISSVQRTSSTIPFTDRWVIKAFTALGFGTVQLSMTPDQIASITDLAGNPLRPPVNAVSYEVERPYQGTVYVKVTPNTAPWVLTDVRGTTYSGTGDATIPNVPGGDVMLTWLPLAGYDTPPTNNVMKLLPALSSVTFIDFYSLTGSANDNLYNSILRYLLGITHDPTDLDANGDGTVDIADLLAVRPLLPPGMPFGPLPTDGATSVTIWMGLNWSPTPRTISYDLYTWMDGQPRPALPTVQDLHITNHNPNQGLEWLTDYHWQLVAKNNDLVTTGPVWTFTTMANPMHVLSPENGAVWTVGSQVGVHWMSDFEVAGTAVRIELWNDSGKVANLGTSWSPTSNGMLKAFVPNVTPGNRYKLRIVSLWLEFYNYPHPYNEMEGNIEIQ